MFACVVALYMLYFVKYKDVQFKQWSYMKYAKIYTIR